MTRQWHTRLTAWLGLLALWLGLAVPVVTQMLAASENAALPAVSFAESCSAHTARAIHALADDSGEAAPKSSTHHDKHCSYCGFLAHHLPLASGGFDVARASTAFVPAVRARSLGFRPIARFSPNRPRGPPADSCASV